MKSTIDKLIVNSPYEEPAHFWSYDRETRFFTLKDGRRPAGYVTAKIKREFLDEWVKAVNQQGGFGEWTWAVSKDPADVSGIIRGIENNL